MKKSTGNTINSNLESSYLINKSITCIRDTILELSNRKINENYPYCQDPFKTEQHNNKIKNEIYIDKISLYKAAIEIAKKRNAEVPSPYLFELALKNIISPTKRHDLIETSDLFVIQKIKIIKNEIFHIIF